MKYTYRFLLISVIFATPNLLLARLNPLMFAMHWEDRFTREEIKKVTNGVLGEGRK
jgi:hypothetical protein